MLFVLSAALALDFPDRPEWISARVLVCGLAAVGLLILALLMRGLQKVVAVLAAIFFAVGAYWFITDFWKGRKEVLPAALASELDSVATRTLNHPDAVAAWSAAQREWTHLTGEARARLSKGGDAARLAVARRLDAKASDLRRAGKRAAADEVARMRAKVAPEPQGGF